MAKATKPGRPTNTMMKAVNLNLAGKENEAKQLLDSEKHRQHTLANLKRFTAARKDKGPYEIGGTKAATPKPKRRGRGRAKAKPQVEAVHEPGDVLGMIDGRTKLSTLVRLEAKIQALIAGKDRKEVDRMRKAAKEVEDLRKQLAEAEALLK